MKLHTITCLALACCAPAQKDLALDLDGIWMSDGYGLVAEIHQGRARAYQFAGDICIPQGQRWERLPSFLDGIDVAVQPDGQTALIAPPHAQHRIKARRIQALPAPCRTPPEDTPAGNFDAFAAFFAANYAFFDLYGVDWASRVAAARADIHPDMSDADLFQLMARMMAPLKDGHLELTGRVGRKDLRFEPNIGRTHRALTEAATRDGRSREDITDAFHRAFWKGNIQNGLLAGKGRSAGNKRIQYGIVDGNVGYIALVTLAGYSGGQPDPKRDLQMINSVMEEALASFQDAGARAVILDLSVNYGGFDFVARAIAERFADQERHAYTKYAGDAAAPIRTAVTIKPSTGTRFEGPVFVLTSNITISAGEILTLALRALPNVTHVGEPTRGALSDVLDRTLPNGWELSLSNEVYLDSRGIAWEGRSIQPDWQMSVLPDDNPVAGHLMALRRLLAKI